MYSHGSSTKWQASGVVVSAFSILIGLAVQPSYAQAGEDAQNTGSAAIAPGLKPSPLSDELAQQIHKIVVAQLQKAMPSKGTSIARIPEGKVLHTVLKGEELEAIVYSLPTIHGLFCSARGAEREEVLPETCHTMETECGSRGAHWHLHRLRERRMRGHTANRGDEPIGASPAGSHCSE